MKKLDSILKKAAFFEKLAVYGNRKSFLRSLAQAGGLSEDIKAKLNNLLKDLSKAVPSSTLLQTELTGFLTGNKTDMAELSLLVEQAALAFPRQPQYAMQSENALKLSSMLNQVMVMPADKITGYLPIPKLVQEHLSEIVSTNGWGIPVTADGRIGKETRKAIDQFKNERRIPMNTPDSKVFEEIEKFYSQNQAAKTLAEMQNNLKYMREGKDTGGPVLSNEVSNYSNLTNGPDQAAKTLADMQKNLEYMKNEKPTSIFDSKVDSKLSRK